jgi:hypothetical protein
MTATFEIVRRGKPARVSFIDRRIMVVIDGYQVTIANPPKRGSGRRSYWACEAHCRKLCDRALAKIEKWKADREAKELAAEKDHAYA